MYVDIRLERPESALKDQRQFGCCVVDSEKHDEEESRYIEPCKKTA